MSIRCVYTTAPDAPLSSRGRPIFLIDVAPKN